jgi:hypothetical protein
VKVSFPIYVPDVAVNGGIDDLVPKLLAVLEAALDRARADRARALQILADPHWPTDRTRP